jgi:hypothetical protein
MLLLTWHATILRVEHAQNRLIHTPLVPARPAARDFVHVAENEARLVPAATHPNAAHLVNGEMVLAARPDVPFPSFESAEPGPDHIFLPLPEADVSMLRALLSGPWRHAETGETIKAADIELQPGFVLVIGAHRLNLAEARPTQGAGGTLHLPGGGSLLPMQKLTHAEEIALLPAAAELIQVENGDALMAAAAACLVITGEHLAFLPLTGSTAARDWLYRPGSVPPPTGPQACTTTLRHQREAGLLIPAGDGAYVFTQDGLLHGGRPQLAALPPGVSREADTLYVAQPALAASPLLEGPVLLPTAAANDLPATLVQLYLLDLHAPGNARLLLPNLAAEAVVREAWLTLIGMGERKHLSQAATKLCRAMDLYWVADGELATLPPAAIRAVRDRAHAALPAGEPERLFIADGLANAPMARTSAGKQGYTVIEPAALSAFELATRFRRAAFIIAPHGRVLDYLLFCAAGTRVIELAPETGWDPRTAILAGKLDLVHAVLPCKLEDGLPRLELPALAMLQRLMQARL